MKELHHTLKCLKCQCQKDRSLFYRLKNGAMNKVCRDCLNSRRQELDKRIINRICIACGIKPAKKGNQRCDECRKSNNLRLKLKRQENLAKGLCMTCGKEKPKPGYIRCQKCFNKYNNIPISLRLFRGCKRRAQHENIEFTITENEIHIPTHCPILGIELQVNEYSAKSNSYSIDRIDPSKGYVSGNIQVISHRANQLKNDATLEELEKILQFMKQFQCINSVK